MDPESVGFETCAYIGLYLKDPSSFEEVTLALKKIPEVRYIAYCLKDKSSLLLAKKLIALQMVASSFRIVSEVQG